MQQKEANLIVALVLCLPRVIHDALRTKGAW